MGLERIALPTSWGRIGPECLNLTVPAKGTHLFGLASGVLLRRRLPQSLHPGDVGAGRRCSLVLTANSWRWAEEGRVSPRAKRILPVRRRGLPSWLTPGGVLTV